MGDKKENEQPPQDPWIDIVYKQHPEQETPDAWPPEGDAWLPDGPEYYGGPRIPETLGGPKISTNPLDFGTVQEGSSEILEETLINPNNAPLLWNVSVMYVPAGTSWLSSNLLSGTIPPMGQQALSVTANTSTLTPGTYLASLNFSGNFSPDEQVAVNLVVQ